VNDLDAIDLSFLDLLGSHSFKLLYSIIIIIIANTLRPFKMWMSM